MIKIKTRQELIKLYLEFFKSKNHKIIPSASLIPENDPTVLFTTAGMHPLVPYFTGQEHPSGNRLTNNQKCIRTVDIDEIGDTYHHTFFEMLGNWSLGDYWKEQAIELTYEFLTKQLKIPKEKLAVTCFKGDKRAPKDTESEKIWKDMGISKERITFLNEDNWWGPAGETGPCGPSTEIFFSIHNKTPKKFNPNDKKWIEIGNNVLLNYIKTEKGFEISNQKTIDFGGGVERTLAILNNLDDNYLTSAWQPIIKQIEQISNKQYKENQKTMRIIADHIKAAIMILSDNKQIAPSNLEQGYVIRRLIRRAIRYGKLLDINKPFISELVEPTIQIYPDYPELKSNKKSIIKALEQEQEKFSKTLDSGLRKFHKLKGKFLSGKDAFLLFQSYGFPIEMTLELAKEENIKINIKEYEKELQKHQALSRTATQGQFKSGLADDSEKTTKLHTSAHLLNQALKQILNKDIEQKGSNINSERLRFDFNFERKLTEQEIKKIQDLVNEKIKQAIEITKQEMPVKEAFKSGAHGTFGAKYPPIVSVYTIGNFSKEICTGPHVKNTKEIGKFKIIKEQSSSAGVRRIKAVVE